MWVVTADQIASRTGPDLVADVVAGTSGAIAGYERTVGDEVQAVYDDASAVVTDVLALLRTGNWRVGIGAGEVETPMPESPRAGRGEAYILAREAVESTKIKGAPPVAVLGANGRAAATAQALLRLIVAVRSKRTEGGWEVYDLAEAGWTGTQIAAELNITPQAVSDRAAAGLLTAEAEAIAPLVRALRDAQ